MKKHRYLRIYHIVAAAAILLYSIDACWKLYLQTQGEVSIQEGALVYYSYKGMLMQLFLLLMIALAPDIVFFVRKMRKTQRALLKEEDSCKV